MSEDPAYDALKALSDAEEDRALAVVSGGDLREATEEVMARFGEFLPHAKEILSRIGRKA